MSSAESLLEPTRQRVQTLRGILLQLHKALLEFERRMYERTHGQIQSRGEFFRLVVGHEWFSWLRPMSQFIVQIDDVLGAKEPATLADLNGLLAEAQSLLRPDEDGTTSEQRYYDAIQQDADIAYMHMQAASVLNRQTDAAE